MAQITKGNKLALVGVQWDETSGVDHPANETEEWLVVKAADPGADPDADDDQEETNDAAILNILLSDFLQDAPPDVLSAAETVLGYINDAESNENDTSVSKQDTNKVVKKNKITFVASMRKFLGLETDKERFEKAQSDFLDSLSPNMTVEQRVQAVRKFRKDAMEATK